MESHRAERVSEALREELEELIGYELTDPRLGTVYVSEVRVSPDMRLATVRVGTGGDEAANRETLKVLEGARNFLRRVARVGLATRRAAQQQRDLAIRLGLLRQVVVHDQRVLAVYFDKNRKVTRLSDYGLEDGKPVDFLSRTTPVAGPDYHLIQALLSKVSL